MGTGKFIKMSMLLLQMLVIWLGFGVSRGAIGESCGSEDGYVWHEVDKNSGERRCCLQIECAAGQYPVACTREKPTLCKACREGRYSKAAIKSGPYLDCHEKSSCPPGMVTVDIKSHIHDTICTCGIGRENNAIGDACDECRYGFFKSEIGNGPCRMWKSCGDSAVIIAGTASTDRECKSDQELQRPTQKLTNLNSTNTSTTFARTSPGIEDTTQQSATTNRFKASSKESEKDDGSRAIIIACSCVFGVLVAVAAIVFVIYKRKKIKEYQKTKHDSEANTNLSTDIRTLSGTIVHNSEYGSKPQSINALRSESTRCQEYSDNRLSVVSGSDTSSQNPNDDSGIGNSSNNLNQKSNTRAIISSSSKSHNISLDEESLLSTDGNYMDMKLTADKTMQNNNIFVPQNPDTLPRNDLSAAGRSDINVNTSYEDLIGQKILLAAPDMDSGQGIANRPLAKIEREAAEVRERQSVLLANIQRQNSAHGYNNESMTPVMDKGLKPEYSAGIGDTRPEKPSLKIKQLGCVSEKEDEDIRTPIPCTGDNEHLQLSKSPYWFDKPLSVTRTDVINPMPDPSSVYGVQIFIGESHFKGSNIQIS